MTRKLLVLALLSIATAGWATAAKPEANPAVTILTQNMDDGTDLTYVIGALAVPGFPLSVPEAVDLTYAELGFSNFGVRAGLLAREIADRTPDLVALQEAALWRIGPTAETATNILYDNLELLLSALSNLGVPYDVVAVNTLSDLALPGTSGAYLRFTDRNAVLVRSDLRPPEFHLSNVHARTFATAFPFAGLTVPAGWISADVHMGNKQFRFVTTHLQSPIEGIPEATDVQVGQAQELIHALRNSQIPVVICGDFNSDALQGGFVDTTPTAPLFVASGYEETWPKTHGSGDLGLSWPYYLEDLFPGGGLPPPFFESFSPFERIDLFFSRGMEALNSELVVVTAPGEPMPPYASDHAGVVAVFRP